MSKEQNTHSDATTGRDSLGKLLRRNLSFSRVKGLFSRGVRTIKRQGWQAFFQKINLRIRLALHMRPVWYHLADIPLRHELRAQRKNPPAPSPLVSIVVPLYNTPIRYFKQLIASVRGQSYTNFQLVLADGSDDEHKKVGKLAARLARKDARICYVKLRENTGISGNTNEGLAHANGEWIVLADHDDILQKNALYELISAANATGATLIFSDEIVVEEKLKNMKSYHFKGDYGPDTLRGVNYIAHLCGFTSALLKEAGGGEKSEYDGAQDYDLILRLSEKAHRVHHIPKVLYFWRSHGGSTAQDISQKPKAIHAGADAVQSHLERIGLKGSVSPIKNAPGALKVRYEVVGNPLVSVVIPSCDHTDDLRRCLASLYAKGGWENMQVLVVDNNSKKGETPVFYEEAKKTYPTLQVIQYEGEFNFSAICNFGVRHAKGEQLLLLNNDVELLTEGFVREMLSYSQRSDVGAVGAMLYYPDDKIQHAGLIVGITGTAGVSHKGSPRGTLGSIYRLATTQNLSAVTGAALMVKSDLYTQLNGLDETNFAVAYNDVDFCLRLAEKGLWNVFTPFAEAYHYESKSRGYDTEGPAKARLEKESAAFRTRWAEFLQKGDPFYNPHYTLDHEHFGHRA